MKNKVERTERLDIRLTMDDRESLQVVADLYFEGNMSLTIRSLIRKALREFKAGLADNNMTQESGVKNEQV